MTTRERYEDEVDRLGTIMFRAWEQGEPQPSWEALVDWIERESEWITNPDLHEDVLAVTRYHFGPGEHAALLREMRPGDDWRRMRLLTARAALASDVFSRFREIQEDFARGSRKKRWLRSERH